MPIVNFKKYEHKAVTECNKNYEEKIIISAERKEKIFRNLIDYVSEHTINNTDFYNALTNIIGLSDYEIAALDIEIE